MVLRPPIHASTLSRLYAGSPTPTAMGGRTCVVLDESTASWPRSYQAVAGAGPRPVPSTRLSGVFIAPRPPLPWSPGLLGQ